ncbi:MAG: hypothetical protein JXB13_08195 [Phycisphaerae bacterium]|nr:hypothetical protein [Phycisphaerae bacterium]
MAFGLLGLTGMILAGPLVVTRRIVERIPLAGQSEAVVLHRYGNVVIVGTADARASVDALVRVAARDRKLAREFADGIKIRTSGQGDSLVIATTYPSKTPPDPELGYDVQLSVRLPARTIVSVGNSFGDVRVVGMNGDCRVVNRFGDVELDRCDRCEVENSYGRVRLAETRGLAVVRNSYGDVDLRVAGGPVQVRNRYGTVHTEQSADDVTIDNQFGNVFARPDRGAIWITNRYGDVNAWVDDAELAALSIISRLGRVDLSLNDQVPFRIDAAARGGRIVSGLPFDVRRVGAGQLVSARQGEGGPRIEIQGVWSDFAIHGGGSGSDTPSGER